VLKQKKTYEAQLQRHMSNVENGAMATEDPDGDGAGGEQRDAAVWKELIRW
jgi:hypothetical protein